MQKVFYARVFCPGGGPLLLPLDFSTEGGVEIVSWSERVKGEDNHTAHGGMISEEKDEDETDSCYERDKRSPS